MESLLFGRTTVTGIGHLAGLLSTFDSSAPAVTLLRVAAGNRMIGPPVDGVVAMLVLVGTLYLEIGDDPPILVRSGQMVLVPAGLRPRLAACDRPRKTIDGQDCLQQSGGWLMADASDGRESGLLVGAGRIAGTGLEALKTTIVANVVKCPIGKPLFGLLRTECVQRGAGRSPIANALMNACVVQGLHLAIEDRETGAAAAPDTRNVIAGALAAVRAQPGAPHTVDTLAEHAGMSRSSFVRHFTRIMRTGPADYVQKARLDEARTMLDTTELPVKTVAARSGFASRSHFSRAFRKAFGKDPSGYRDRDDESGED